MYTDPHSGTVRYYNSNGYPIDGNGLYAYNPAADEDRNKDEIIRRQREQQEAAAAAATRRRAAGGSLSGTGNPGGWLALILLGGLVILMMAIWQTASTLVRYHWMETLILAAVAAGALYASSRRERLFPESVKKQKVLRVFARCLIGVALVAPPTLAVRSYFFRPPLPLAIEKLDSFFFNPENYRGLGEEGAKAILEAAKSNPAPPRYKVFKALAATGDPAIKPFREALMFGGNGDQLCALGAISNMGESAEYLLPELCQYLSYHPNSDERRAAERAIVELGPVIVPALEGSLRERGPDTRALASYALALMGENAKPALSTLESSITDREGLVRQNALWAISRMRSIEETTAKKVAAALKDPFLPARWNALAFFQNHPEHASKHLVEINFAAGREENWQLQNQLRQLAQSATPR
jgi:hypothetical protein